MVPNKQMINHNDAPSKNGTNTNNGSTVPPHDTNHKRATNDAGSFSSQRIATSAHPPLFDGQILQMPIDMKEQMKEQQARSDHDQYLKLKHNKIISTITT